MQPQSNSNILTGIEASILLSPSITKKETSCKYSYGIDPFGYTCRLGCEYIENKEKREGLDVIVINPLQFLLVSTLETFFVPNNITGLIYGKSSYLRQGLMFSFGVVDAGFHNANLSFPVYNASSSPIKLHIGEGIAQIVFFKGEKEAKEGYSGQYNNKTGVVTQ